MPIFKNVFACRSSDNERQDELVEIRTRINNLEMRYDNLHDLLREIRTSIEMIRLRLDIITNQQQHQ